MSGETHRHLRHVVRGMPIAKRVKIEIALRQLHVEILEAAINQGNESFKAGLKAEANRISVLFGIMRDPDE